LGFEREVNEGAVAKKGEATRVLTLFILVTQL
jgi:hypothetical protein